MKKNTIINLKELASQKKSSQQKSPAKKSARKPRTNSSQQESPLHINRIAKSIAPKSVEPPKPKAPQEPAIKIEETNPLQETSKDGFIDFDLPIDHVWETSLKNKQVSFTPPKKKDRWSEIRTNIENAVEDGISWVKSSFSGKRELPKITSSLTSNIPTFNVGGVSKPQLSVFIGASVLVFVGVVGLGARSFVGDAISLARIQATVTGDDVQTSVGTSDLGQIADSLDQASQDIVAFREQLVSVSGQGSSSRFVAGVVSSWSSEIIKESSDLTAAIAGLSRDLSPFLQNQVDPFDENSEKNLVDVLGALEGSLETLQVEFVEFQSAYDNLPTWMIPVARGELEAIDQTLTLGKASLDDIASYISVTKELVGSDQQKTYLFIFQNNQEARATGGFIGTFGLMTIDQGVVESLDIKEIYNPDGQLRDKIVAPEPIQELTPRWFLRDSNWFPDFPKSSEKIMDFYEKTGGPTVDGIISLTPTVIERFLRLTGEIDMPEYGVTVTADNFLLVTQYQTSVAYDREENKPKQFVADLAPILLNRILSPQAEFGELADLVSTAIEEKHMLFYLNNPEKQKLLADLGVTGEIRQTGGDYLMVVNSNIGGKKTDGVMREDIHQKVTQKSDGRYVNTVTITRTHLGGNTEYDWWNDENINFMRVYVPKGSKLISAEGFDYRPQSPIIDEQTAGFKRDNDVRALETNQIEYSEFDVIEQEDSGQTVFAGWVVTPPQQERVITLEYELPFRDKRWYSLITQKQHGSIATNYSFEFESPRRTRVFQSSFETTEDTESIFSQMKLRTDQAIGIELN